MPDSTLALVVDALYIVAFGLFIYGLMGLTGPKTAVRGNYIAAVGMVLAVVATLVKIFPTATPFAWGVIVVGAAIGIAGGVPSALKTKMTAMPQLVAFFNGMGGGTVALIAWSEFITSRGFSDEASGPAQIGGSLFGAIIGSISFWGSIIAYAKLQEILSGRPISIGKLQQPLNLVLFAVAIASAVVIGVKAGSGGAAWWWIVLLLVSAGVLGVFVVLPIGGADMPVVISLLNALTGLSAAAAGLALDNLALVVAGMIVGASGTILTNLMAKAMNRSIPSIVAGGFGGGSSAVAAGGADAGDKQVKATNPSDAAILLSYANQVIVVPGYGLAVAQAQHAVKDMAKMLESKGVEVKYAIHPVAGRMPGHMNVLLAEADVPYEALKEMDEINDEFKRTDVAIVLGANDVTNPAARNDPSSPIHGMPVLNVDEAKSVIVVKRGMSSGFAGIDNPLFYAPNTTMLFGDAKKVVGELIDELKAL